MTESLIEKCEIKIIEWLEKPHGHWSRERKNFNMREDLTSNLESAIRLPDLKKAIFDSMSEAYHSVEWGQSPDRILSDIQKIIDKKIFGEKPKDKTA